MKFLQKLLAVVAVSAVLMFSIAGINAFATSTTQDGLEISLTTDKETYTKDEKITATLSVKNTNESDVTDILMETVVPNGYEVADGTNNIKQIDKLTPNEATELKVVYVSRSNSEVSQESQKSEVSTVSPINDSPTTGDNGFVPIAVVIVLLVSVLSIAICIKSKNVRKMLSIVLIVSIISCVLPMYQITTLAVDTEKHEVIIESVIDFNGSNLAIKGVIEYSIKILTDNIDKNDIEKQIKQLGLDDVSNWDKFPDKNNNGVPDELDYIMGIGTDHFDSDNDGLPDFIEEKLGSNKNKSDSDSDQLPDGYEIFTLQTLPTKIDTDENGVSDTYEDFDGDGLTNIEEYLLNTNPYDKDTDGDLLSDADEINKYKTDPLKEDTDGDGLVDGDEITHSMDPLKSDTLGDGIPDGDRIFEISIQSDSSDDNSVKPRLEVELSGNQIGSLDIQKIKNDDAFLNDTIPGYLGNAYDFSLDGNPNEAILSFDIDSKYFEDEGFTPAIYYWDSDNQTLIELPNQELNGHTISVRLPHFSSYIVLDKNKFNVSVLQYEILAPTDSEMQNIAFDIALSLDESGSISIYDYATMKKLCADLIGKLSENDNVSVYTYDDSIRTIVEFTDKETAIQYILDLSQHRGDTSVYDALKTAIGDLVKLDDTNTKIVVTLTDGDDNRSYATSDSIIEYAKSNNVVVYTVGVGSYVNTNELKKIAENTGGQYYNTSNFDELSGVFDRLVTDSDLYKDSDGDGISDYHEKKIASGELKNGMGVALPNFGSLNYLNEDSDGDGIIDGEELEIKEKIVNGNSVYYCYMYSNPCLSDSDNDGLDDVLEIYAGYNPLLNEELLVNNSNTYYDYLTKNTRSEWKKMAKEHAYNYIHIAVQNDIWQKNSSWIRYGEYSLKGTDDKVVGRIDVIDKTLTQIWDVKPASYQTSPNREKGIKQLENYIELGRIQNPPLSLVKGGYGIAGRTITVGNYNVRYNNTGSGLIVYNFQRKTPEPDEVPVYVPAKEPATDRNKEKYTPRETTSAWGWAMIISGTVLIIGTVAEDFFTFGAGTVDDIPSFIAAEELIRNGFAY